MNTKKVHIVGLGKSGSSAAELMLSEGWEVIISDDNDNLSLRAKMQIFENLGCKVFLGSHEDALQQEVDLTVISPGIKMDSGRC